MFIIMYFVYDTPRTLFMEKERVVGFFQLLILFLNVIYLLSVSEQWLRTQPYGFITPRAGVSEHYVT